MHRNSWGEDGFSDRRWKQLVGLHYEFLGVRLPLCYSTSLLGRISKEVEPREEYGGRRKDGGGGGGGRGRDGGWNGNGLFVYFLSLFQLSFHSFLVDSVFVFMIFFSTLPRLFSDFFLIVILLHNSWSIRLILCDFCWYIQWFLLIYQPESLTSR